MKNLDDLTIIIVTYKTNKDILFDCLNSINPKIKILIVENSNNIEFKLELENTFSNVSVLLSQKNLGYGAGNNLGLKKIKTRYGLISNPDVVYEGNFFDKIDLYLNNEINFSIIGPSYFDNSGYSPFGAFDNKNDKILKDKKYDSNFLKKVDWVVGCSLLVDTQNIDKNDFFDENIFLYFEEIDLCRRIIKKGGEIYNSSILKIKHLGHKGSAATDPQYSIETEMFRNWHWMWSSFYYHKKHNDYFYAVFKMFGKFTKSFIKSIVFFILNDNVKRTMYFARFYGLLCAFIGTKSFYRVRSLFK